MKKLFISLVFALMGIAFTTAQEAYVEYTTSSHTLTFYYDTQRATRPGVTYSISNAATLPSWYDIRNDIVNVEFDSSFADARPISTYHWFGYMTNLTSINGMNYLNTS